jgi:hypothetical protein
VSAADRQEAFPPFRSLPDIYENENTYYIQGQVSDEPLMHWYFLGEITANASVVRPVFHVRDREGKVVVVGLYLDDKSLYKASDYKVGNTICIMYAKRKQFLDGTVGIRVEDGKSLRGHIIFGYRAHCSFAMYVAKVTGDWKLCRW